MREIEQEIVKWKIFSAIGGITKRHSQNVIMMRFDIGDTPIGNLSRNVVTTSVRIAHEIFL